MYFCYVFCVLGTSPIAQKKSSCAVSDTKGLVRHARQGASRLWPGIGDHSREFEKLLANKCGEDLHWEELYLSLACLESDERAVASFEEHYVQEAVPALACRGLQRSDIDEALQLLRIRLLAGPNAKLSLYSGIGSLAGFVRTAAIRVALNKIRSEGNNRDALAQLLSLEHEDGQALDPELEHLKQGYAEAFATAMEQAWQRIDSTDRVWLRHQLDDHMSIDQLGLLYRMHRSSAARRLATARQRLLDATRDCLKGQTGLDTRELTSALRLARSRLQFDFSRSKTA